MTIVTEMEHTWNPPAHGTMPQTTKLALGQKSQIMSNVIVTMDEFMMTRECHSNHDFGGVKIDDQDEKVRLGTLAGETFERRNVIQQR